MKLQIDTTSTEIEAANALLARAIEALEGDRKKQIAFGLEEKHVTRAKNFRQKMLKAFKRG